MKNIPIISVFTVFILLTVACSTLFTGNKKRPRTRFRIEEKEIELGDSVTLTWEIEDANNIRIEDVAENLPPVGQLTLQPDTTTSYLLIVERDDETKKRRQTVETYVPEVSYIEAPDSVSDEDEFEIKWRVRNSRYASLKGIYDSLPTYGNRKLKRDSTTKFILIAHGKYQIDTMSARTKVHVIESFEGPDKIFRGQAATLSWSLKRTDSVKLKDIDTTLKAKDRIILHPKQTMVVNLLAYKNYGGIKPYMHVITVLPPRVLLRGSTVVLDGEEAKINWRVYGGDSIRLNDTSKNLPYRGTRVFVPKKDTAVFLHVYDGENVLTRKLVIHVIPDRPFIKGIKHVKELESNERIDMDFFSWQPEMNSGHIHNNIIVVDTSGHYITGLVPESYEDKTPPPVYSRITYAEDAQTKNMEFTAKEILKKHEEVPEQFNVVVLLDISHTSPNEGNLFFSTVEQVVKDLKPDDSLQMILYNDTLQHFTISLADSNLTKVKPDHAINTSVWRMMYGALGYSIEKCLIKGTNNNIIMLNAGPDNASFLNPMGFETGLNEMAKKLDLYQAKLFVVNYQNNHDYPVLKSLADYSGGKIYNIREQKNIANALKEIIYGLSMHYQLKTEILKDFTNFKVSLKYMNKASGYTEIQREIDILPENYHGMLMDTNSYWYESIDGYTPVLPPRPMVFFQKNEDVIEPHFYPKLDNIVQILQNHHALKLFITGHSDLTGTAQQCEKISEKRAESVYKYLLDKGIHQDRLYLQSCSKDFPVWNENGSFIKSYENRRVDVIFMH